MKRYRITRILSCNCYVIIDRLKLWTPIKNKRYTNRLFCSVEQAQGFLFARGKFEKVIVK
jgi:hypothetical protein